MPLPPLYLGRSYRPGFWSLAALHDTDDHTLSFAQRHEPGALQRRGVHEDVLPAAIPNDKAEPLGGVVPLHGPRFGHASFQIRQVGWGWQAGPRTADCDRRAAVHGDDFGNDRTALTLGHAQLERLAGLHGADSKPRQHGRVQEGITGSVRELDEPEPLSGVEPFHSATNRHLGGFLGLRSGGFHRDLGGFLGLGSGGFHRDLGAARRIARVLILDRLLFLTNISPSIEDEFAYHL